MAAVGVGMAANVAVQLFTGLIDRHQGKLRAEHAARTQAFTQEAQAYAAMDKNLADNAEVVERTRASLAAAAAAQQQQAALAAQAVATLERDIVKQRAQLEALREEARTAGAEEAEVAAEIARLTYALAYAEAKLAELNLVLARLNAQAQQAQRTQEEIQADRAQLQAEEAVARQEEARAKEERTQLEQQLAADEATRRSLEGREEALAKQQAEGVAKEQILAAAIANAEAEIQEFAHSIEHVRALVAKLAAEVAALESQLAATTDWASTDGGLFGTGLFAKKTHHSREHERQALAFRIRQKQDMISDHRNAIASLEDRSRNAAATREQQQAARAQLAAELQQAGQSLTDARVNLRAAKRALTQRTELHLRAVDKEARAHARVDRVLLQAQAVHLAGAAAQARVQELVGEQRGLAQRQAAARTDLHRLSASQQRAAQELEAKRAAWLAAQTSEAQARGELESRRMLRNRHTDLAANAASVARRYEADLAHTKDEIEATRVQRNIVAMHMAVDREQLDAVAAEAAIAKSLLQAAPALALDLQQIVNSPQGQLEALRERFMQRVAQHVGINVQTNPS